MVRNHDACSVAVDRRPLLAAIGVISHTGSPRQRALRMAIRETWLPEAADARMAARFVLRAESGAGGADEAAAARREAGVNGDVILLTRVRARLGQGAGALSALIGWFDLGPLCFPAATLIGKAEDDVWVDIPGISRFLQQSLDLLMASSGYPGIEGETSDVSERHLYWGTMESYHWSLRTHTPHGWKYWVRPDRLEGGAGYCHTLR